MLLLKSCWLKKLQLLSRHTLSRPRSSGRKSGGSSSRSITICKPPEKKLRRAQCSADQGSSIRLSMPVAAMSWSSQLSRALKVGVLAFAKLPTFGSKITMTGNILSLLQGAVLHIGLCQPCPSMTWSDLDLVTEGRGKLRRPVRL